MQTNNWSYGLPWETVIGLFMVQAGILVMAKSKLYRLLSLSVIPKKEKQEVLRLKNFHLVPSIQNFLHHISFVFVQDSVWTLNVI